MATRASPNSLLTRLGRSPVLRALLALSLALWTPVCLCSATDHAENAGVQQAAEDRDDHAPGQSCHHHDDELAATDDDGHHTAAPSHDGCPGHDSNKGGGCECFRPALQAKAEVDLKIAAPVMVVAVLSWALIDWATPVERFVAQRAPIGAVPRPPTSLLKMHCALTV